jgi:hypothetical protein
VALPRREKSTHRKSVAVGYKSGPEVEKPPRRTDRFISECGTYSAVFSAGSVPFRRPRAHRPPSDSLELLCCVHPTAPSRYSLQRQALLEASGQPTAECHLRPTDESGRKWPTRSRSAREGPAREPLSVEPRRCRLRPSGGPRRAGLFRRRQEEHPQCARIVRRSVRNGDVGP